MPLGTGESLVSQAGVVRPLLRLALPVLLEQFLLVLVGFTDQWLAGEFLRDDHLAAIGMISYVLWLIPAVFGAVAIGATAVVARSVGSGDRSTALAATNQSLLIGMSVVIPVTVAAWWGAGSFSRWMALEPAAAELASQYIRLLAPFLPAMMLQQIGVACLRGAGRMGLVFAVMAVVNLVNAATGAALVSGWGPFPQLGWIGLAIGTAAAYATGGGLILTLLWMGAGPIAIRFDQLRPHPELIRRILRVGVPGGLDMLAVVSCHLWFLAIVNALGTAAAAAHGLGIRIESLAYLPGAAFQMAAATLTGQLLGAGQPARAVRSGLIACLLAGSLMTAAGAAFYCYPRQLALLLLSAENQRTAELAEPLLRVVAFSMPALAVSIVLTGALRGAGETRVPLLVSFVGFLGVRMPLAYFLAWPAIWLSLPTGGAWQLPALGLGVVGAWYAMVLDIFVRSLLTALWYWRGDWTAHRA